MRATAVKPGKVVSLGKFMKLSNYYLSKPCTPDLIIDVHKSLRVKSISDGYYDRIVSSVRTWVIDNPNPVTNRKDVLIPLSTEGKCVKTGYSLIVGDDRAQEYEFGKTVQNLIISVFQRLLVSQVSVDSTYITRCKPHV